jgi:outer membrane protein TolC
MKPMKIRSVIVMGLVLTCLVWTVDQARAATVKYQDIGSYFQKGHPLLEPEVYQIKSRKTRVGHLERSFRPRVRVETGYESYSSPVLEDNQSPYLVAEASVNLYRGGQDVLAGEIANLGTEIAELTFVEQQHHLVFKSKRLFWQIAGYQERLRLINRQNEWLMSIRDRILRKINNGVAPPSDREVWRMAVDELAFDKRALEHILTRKKSSLGYLLGMPPGEVAKLQTHYQEVWQTPVVRLLDEAEHSSAHVKILATRAEKLKLEARKKELYFRPSIELWGQTGQAAYRHREFSDPADRRESVIGLRVSLPLSQWWTADADVKALSHEAAANVSERQNQQRKLSAHYDILKQQLHEAQDLLEQARQLAARHKKLFDRRLDEYERGIRTTPELIDQLQNRSQIGEKVIDLQTEEFLLMECLNHIEGAEQCM